MHMAQYINDHIFEFHVEACALNRCMMIAIPWQCKSNTRHKYVSTAQLAVNVKPSELSKIVSNPRLSTMLMSLRTNASVHLSSRQNVLKTSPCKRNRELAPLGIIGNLCDSQLIYSTMKGHGSKRREGFTSSYFGALMQ